MRISRRKKVTTIYLPDGWIFKMRLAPYIRTKGSCVWLASLAVARSNRQINDWLVKRKKQSTTKLSQQLTGQFGPRIQALAIRQVRQWVIDLPSGDSIALRCESALPDKQYQVWKKWFANHESNQWKAQDNYRSFWYYKPMYVE